MVVPGAEPGQRLRAKEQRQPSTGPRLGGLYTWQGLAGSCCLPGIFGKTAEIRKPVGSSTVHLRVVFGCGFGLHLHGSSVKSWILALLYPPHLRCHLAHGGTPRRFMEGPLLLKKVVLMQKCLGHDHLSYSSLHLHHWKLV